MTVFIDNMNKINNISFQNNDRVKKFGKTDDGRLIVGVKDIDSDNYIKSTIPEKNYDSFEEYVNNVQGKYGKLAKNNLQKGSQAIYAINIAAATIGAAISATCLKQTSKVKTFFRTIGGALAGVLASSVIIVTVIIHKILNITKTAKTLDIVPYERPANPIKNKQENKKSEPQITEKTESKKEDICEIKNEQQEEE